MIAAARLLWTWSDVQRLSSVTTAPSSFHA